MPRIAFATTIYDQTSVGGGTFVQYLRQAVEDGRLDLVFFSDDISVRQAPYEHIVKIPALVRGLPGGWLTRSYFFHNAIRAEHALRPFDMIWHNNVLTSFYGALVPSGVPVVGMVNDYSNAESRTPFGSSDKYGLARAFIRYCWHQFEKFSAQRADHLVVNSKYMTERITAAYGIDERRVRLLYKGVDLEQFAFNPPKVLSQPIKILFVKREFIRAGLPDLLGAIAGFPMEVQLTVIGPPPLTHPEIMAHADRIGVAEKVAVSGPVGRDQIASYFHRHDILCIPSRSEALGVAFMEALASGLPAVGTNLGGIPEVLDYGNAGWLAKPSDPASVRRALLDVIENDETRAKKISHGRAYVARFSQKNMIEDMHAIARAVVDTSTVTKPCV